MHSTPDGVRESIWRGAYAPITIGAVTLIFLAALQSLAVTTIMPVISVELDGRSLYALAFAGTLATGVIGMVICGAWCDRSGPVAPLWAAVGTLIVGLLISGVADTMPIMVLGRLVQGLGAGAQTVALYVVVARVFPPALHGNVFAAFSAAWVVPSIVGPALAGITSDSIGWRWVFLGVAALALVAFALLAPQLRSIGQFEPIPARGVLARILLAIVVAITVLAIGSATETELHLGWLIAATGVIVLAVSIRPLLPAGTLVARRGLASVILMRGLVAGAFFGGEAYIPYVLQHEHGYTPTSSGLALTAAALSWVLGSSLQGRYGDRLGSTRITCIAVPFAMSGPVIAALVSVGWFPAFAVIIGWFLTGFGMGLVYPRLTVLTLAYSQPSNQGFNSAVLSISDSAGAAVTIALAGLCFVSFGSGGAGFVAVFVLATVVAVLAFVPGLRMGDAPVRTATAVYGDAG